MVNLDVPKIPEAIKNKVFGASDIKWIKTVNDEVTSSAYLPQGKPPDERVRDSSGACLSKNEMIRNSEGAFFCLQAHNKSNLSTLKQADIGDIILLYQYLEHQKTKCFTHLVTPIGNDIVPDPYPPYGGWSGRWVKVIAMTENQVAYSIPALTSDWNRMQFRVYFGNLSYPNSSIWRIANSKNISGEQLSDKELLDFQNYIWKKFEKWRK